MSEPEAEARPDETARPAETEWRGNDGSHRKLALGCTLVAAIVLVAFWVARAGLLH